MTKYCAKTGGVCQHVEGMWFSNQATFDEWQKEMPQDLLDTLDKLPMLRDGEGHIAVLWSLDEIETKVRLQQMEGQIKTGANPS